MQIDASNFAFGAMLNQNLDKNIDIPIYYANRLMKRAEKKTIQLLKMKH